ncbi:MAG: cell division protein ZapE, partial [Rickettsiales bacterium]|nr:cell division protein ZapE [Rickettsiales bacterium]
MHQHRKAGKDPVTTLAAELAKEAQLLCFDELQATDPADATLLFRLFDGLFAQGVVVVSTSNRPPASLYTGGVQKERFAKFITLLEARMDVRALSSPTDYRYMQLKSVEQVYFWPLGAETNAKINDTIQYLCDDCTPRQDEFVVQGRHIPFTLYSGSMGVFSFRELCASALGPADYLAIAKRLDTVVLTGIPKLSAEMRNEAKRFVTLVDALYEHKVALVAAADAPPEQLYAEGDGHFEFQRTVSRLVEMQSRKYLES